MVKIFAEVYHTQNHEEIDEMDESALNRLKKNPNSVQSSDDLYFLAYSLIMLSTDAASTKIPLKDKMTKHSFVRINKDIFTNLPISYLEEVYDDITS